MAEKKLSLFLGKVKDTAKNVATGAKQAEKNVSTRVGAALTPGVRVAPGSKLSKPNIQHAPEAGKGSRMLLKEDLKNPDAVTKATLAGKGRRALAAVVFVPATATAVAHWLYDGEEYKTKSAAQKQKNKDAEAKAYEKIGKQQKAAAAKKKADAAKKKSAAAKKTGKKKTATAKKKDRRLIFGKDAKFRPFKGKIARALLGEDEKFGGKKGLIDFLNTGGSVTGLSKAQQNMLRQAQQHARSTGQNPKTLQDLVAKYGNQLKGGGRKGKLKGAPRPGGRRNGGEAIAPPPPRIRRTPPAAPAPAASGLSQAQQNLLRGAQQHSRSTGQNPQALQNLTAQHGQLLKPRQGRKAMLPGAPAPGGMKHGGSVGKKGRSSKPRGVGVAKRGYGRAMKK